MKKQLLNAFIGFSLMAMHGCASIGSPEGGARDFIAPKLLSTTPINGQTQVKPEKIILTFDEPIQAIDLNRQLIIAPITENTYKTKVKGNTVELTFDKPWEENTTYSFNFRKGIADITEKNAAKNVVVTFSTGAYVDSGRVTGTVKHLYSAEIPKEANILLYRASDTLHIKKGRPLYATQNDSAGNFTFQNIKEGNYYLYAIAENNNNLRYDSEKEAIAYVPDSITIKPTVTDLNLILHTQDKTNPSALSRKGFLNLYEIGYNEGLTHIDVKKQNAESEVELKWKLEGNGKTLWLFPSKPEESSWIITAHDSAGNYKTDTLKIRLSGAKAPISGNSFSILNGNTMKPGAEMKLSFPVPIKLLDAKGAVSFLLDSVSTVMTTDTSQFQFNANHTEITFKMPLPATREITVSIDTTKLVPFIGQPFQNAKQIVKLSDRTSVGSLKLKFATDQKSYIVQLLSGKEVVRESRNQKSVTWQDLSPGSYEVRVLIDSNGNGKWDNGDLDLRTLPEPVYLHPNSFQIRSDWEIVEDNPIQF